MNFFYFYFVRVIALCKSCNQDSSKTIIARSFKLMMTLVLKKSAIIIGKFGGTVFHKYN